MYDELLNKLFLCSKEVFCSKCKFSYDCSGMKTLIGEAFDAILKMKKKLNDSEMDNCHLMGRLSEEFSKHRWIPVTERLPKEPYGCLAIVWDNPRYGGGDCFLNYYPEYIGYDGTWNDADGEEIPLEVAYWMKMPEIPQPPESEGEI